MSPIDERLRALDVVLPDVMPQWWMDMCRRSRRSFAPVLGDYLRGRAFGRFAGTLLRLLVTGFLVSAASNR